ncbi:MAG: cell division protein, partial [Bacteroidetes bacterium]
MAKVSKEIQGRVYLVFFLVAILFLAVLSKLFIIQFIEGAYWEELARKTTVSYRTIDALRGNIYSDDGRLLATSIPVYEIRWDSRADGLSDKIFKKEVDSLA